MLHAGDDALGEHDEVVAPLVAERGDAVRKAGSLAAFVVVAPEGPCTGPVAAEFVVGDGLAGDTYAEQERGVKQGAIEEVVWTAHVSHDRMSVAACVFEHGQR